MDTAGRATLASVARAAGVSRQTVSNVLNAPERVGPDTAARVRAAITAQRYAPSVAARQLRTRRSHTFGLRLEPAGDGINGSVLDRFLHALTEHAQRAGYRIALFTAPDDTAETLAYEQLLATADVDGFVLTSTHHADPRTAWLRARGVPFVTFGRPWDAPHAPVEVAPHAWVDVDGAAGTRAATEHLLAAGHERIAFVGWPEGSDVGEDRRRGWAEAMATAGRRGPEVRVVNHVQEARAVVGELLRRADVSAVVCASDSLALGAHGSALRSGTPLEVVGFDDTPVAQALGLSSVAQPLVEAAGATVRLLRALVERPEHTDPAHLLLAPRLVVRRRA